MNAVLNGNNLAARVLGNTGGAAIKMAFKIDTIKFSWIDLYLRDKELRLEIKAMRDKIVEVQKSPIHRDELKSMFLSALEGIKSDRRAWFLELLKNVQSGAGAMINSYMVQGRNYIPPVDLPETEIEDMFSDIPIGVKRHAIDLEIEELQGKIARTEEVVARELCPPERWVYRDDGKPVSYPQGCRWTQYVVAWEKVVTRFDGPVSVEGDAIKTDDEMRAYFALQLDKITRILPLRKPS